MYKPNFIYHKNMNSLVLLEKHMPEEKRIIKGGAAAAAAAAAAFCCCLSSRLA
jgi:hypothetical protein